MKTIVFLNQKGGVGKTSSCYHLAGTLAGVGYRLRILLVDADPQASLTQGFFGPSGMEALQPAETVAAILAPEAEPEPEGIIRETGVAGVYIVPGSPAASQWNRLPDDAWPASQWGLRSFLSAATSGYDLCLIDCPPNLHLCSWAALLAADSLVVPLQPEDFGSQGLAPVRASFEAARRFNPGLGLAGYLLTMVSPRTAVHQTYEAILRQSHGPEVFRAVVPRATDYVEAVAGRKPVASYKPRSAAAKAMRAVADELLVRVGVGSEGKGAAA